MCGSLVDGRSSVRKGLWSSYPDVPGNSSGFSFEEPEELDAALVATVRLVAGEH
jgi:hypothetical protein